MPDTISRFLGHHALKCILILLTNLQEARGFQPNLIQNGGFEVASEYFTSGNPYSSDPRYIFPWVLYATEMVGARYELDFDAWPPAERLCSMELVSDLGYGIYQHLNLT